MIEIDKVFELKTHDPSKSLIFSLKYLVQLHFTFKLSVKSGVFSGESSFCISKEELKKSLKKLEESYSQLSGEVKLQDYDSDAFLSFLFEKDGRIIVSGQVGGTFSDHNLKFTFSTDQTVIPPFLTDIEALLKYEDV